MIRKNTNGTFTVDLTESRSRISPSIFALDNASSSNNLDSSVNFFILI